MEKIVFIVDRLNLSPFSKGYSTLAEFDGLSSYDLYNLALSIIVKIDSEQEPIYKEPSEFQIPRIINFLRVMKYDFGDMNSNPDIIDQYSNLLMSYDKDTLHDIIYWCLQKFEPLQKRAYLAKYLLPIDVPPEFMNDDLIFELSNNLKEYQNEFKEVHKSVDKMGNVGNRSNELKSEISQLEQEKLQLQNKINKMKKDISSDDTYFQDMLKATAQLRKEQEDEAMIFQRLRENRMMLQETEAKFSEASRRLSNTKQGGVANQSAEQIFQKLKTDVKDLFDRKEMVESALNDKELTLDKYASIENSDRMMTDDDVQVKREQVRHIEDDVAALKSRLDASLERNPKLTVFRQASAMAQKKLKEKEEDADKVSDEKKRLLKMIADKEVAYENKISQLSIGKLGKADRMRFAAQMAEKQAYFKKLQDDMAKLRAELVTLQRTEQLLRAKFTSEGYGNGNKSKGELDQLSEMTEKRRIANGLTYKFLDPSTVSAGGATVDDLSLEGATLEQVNVMVDKIIKEFKARQAQLQPVMTELRAARQQYSEVEAEYMDKKAIFEKLTVGMEMDKLALEKDCDDCQEECLREESRFHYINNLINMNKIKLDKADLEEKYQNGKSKFLRDFNSYKELYNNKKNQQEQLIKQLRKSKRDLTDSFDATTNQKSGFQNLQALLTAKLQSEQGLSGGSDVAGAGAVDMMGDDGKDMMFDRDGYKIKNEAEHYPF